MMSSGIAWHATCIEWNHAPHDAAPKRREKMNRTLINTLRKYAAITAYDAHCVTTRAALTPAEWLAAARRAADAHTTCPVRIVAGALAPEVRGESYHWTTPGGAPVRYPSAYSRAFGRPVYHASTLRVVVGEDWRPTVSARDAALAG
jgi:hypothetical protein